jgi:hypothetical protein
MFEFINKERGNYNPNTIEDLYFLIHVIGQVLYLEELLREKK